MKKVMIMCWLFLCPTLALAEENVYEGAVVAAVTGDILKVKIDNHEYDIRLAGIDAPDLKQPYGADTLKALNALTASKEVVIREVGTDPCGRMIGLVWIKGDSGLDLSSRLVSEGDVWVYRQYANSDYLIGLELEARNNKQGLWALPEDKRQEPWEWRKRARMQGETPSGSCAAQNDLGYF